MGRSRYIILEPDKPHFLTCTVVEWLPVFTRPDAVQIILDSWSYQRANDGLQLFGSLLSGRFHNRINCLPMSGLHSFSTAFATN